LGPEPACAAEAPHNAEASVAPAEAHAGGEHDIGRELPLWWVLPFAGLLLSIALFPLFTPHFWHHRYPYVSALWALVFAVPFVMVYRAAGVERILHIYIADYIPFIILLAGLFTVSGGIVLRGSLAGTPAVNTLFLAVGTALASLIGTTGASMLLIRPILRANRHRRVRMHIVIFLIFLVSNIGGSLTPLGDPPLFLGFLHGVPFQWTLNLIAPMGVCVVVLLTIFFLLDTILLRRETSAAAPEHSDAKSPLRLAGAHNFVFLLGIVGAVLMSGLWTYGKATDVNILGIHRDLAGLARDAIIVLMGVLAFVATKRELREENAFTWEPIREVAYLFAGIFMTIVPAIAILLAGEQGALRFIIQASTSGPTFFWFTGLLSSFLDNAPTYLTFFNTALGKLHLEEAVVSQFLYGTLDPGTLAALGENLRQFERFLFAISCGAVFMGANTYIGNAPNFMVRSIAEENHVKMPSFFGYMAWSGGILLPLFALITVLFMR
jgi:Na+/H+ antiporter NhaD/arsenite permease-like protein